MFSSSIRGSLSKFGKLALSVLALPLLAFSQSSVSGLPGTSGSPVFWPAQIGSPVFGLPSASAPPLSAWPSTEASGLLIHDVSGNNNTATISGAGAVTWESNAGLPGITPFWLGTGDAQATSATLTNFDGTKAFSAGIWIANDSSTTSTYLSSLNAGAGSFQGWEISKDSVGRLVFFLINTYPGNAIETHTTAAAITGSGRHYMLVSYAPQVDGSMKAAGVAVCVDGLNQPLTSVHDTLTATSANGIPLFFAARSDLSAPYHGAMAFVEMYPYVVPTTQCAINSALGPAIY